MEPKKKRGRPKKVKIEDLVKEAEELKDVKELVEPVEEFQYSYELFKKSVDEFIDTRNDGEAELVKKIKEWRYRR